MSKVGLVVDSTADLDPSYYAQHDVVVVPLTVRFGQDAALDWVQMRPDDFYSRLQAAEELPKTSQPSVKQFADAYTCLTHDCDSVISMHLSSKLSGTVQSAEIAAGQVDVTVTVIDTKLASLGIALVLDEAVKQRDDGAGHGELVASIRQRCAGVRTLFYVDTLKYLEMGGRIGKAQALAGALLRVRPILQLDAEGVVAPFKKVKGAERVYSELANAVKVAAAGVGTARIGFVHAANRGAIDKMKQMLDDEGVKYESVFESSIGSVIGTYIGPGAFGVIFYVDPWPR